MADMNTLEDLYVEQLKDLYSAENQILKALPDIIAAVKSAELKSAFKQHQRQTEEQVQRLEQIFEAMGRGPRGKHCKGMEGVLEEGAELIQKHKKGEIAQDVFEAGIIGAAQHVEHYEMAGYGTVRTWAEQLGHEEAARLLQKTLNEEERTDRKLTVLAESHYNQEAINA